LKFTLSEFAMLRRDLVASFALPFGADADASRIGEIERLADGSLAVVWTENWTDAAGRLALRQNTVVLGEDGVFSPAGIYKIASRAVNVFADVAAKAGGGFRTLANGDPLDPAQNDYFEIIDLDATGAYVIAPIQPYSWAEVGGWKFVELRDGSTALFLQQFNNTDARIGFMRHVANELTLQNLTYVAAGASIKEVVVREGADVAADRLILLYRGQVTSSAAPDAYVAMTDLSGAVQVTTTLDPIFRTFSSQDYDLHLRDDGGVIVSTLAAASSSDPTRAWIQRLDSTMAAQGPVQMVDLPAGTGTVKAARILDRPDGGLVMVLWTSGGENPDGSFQRDLFLHYLTDDGRPVAAAQLLDSYSGPGDLGTFAAAFNGAGQLVLAHDENGSAAVKVYDVATPEMLEGRVFADADGDGRFDAGEGVALAAVSVTQTAVLSVDASVQTGSDGLWQMLLAPVTEAAVSVTVGGVIRHALLDLSDGIGRVDLRDGREWVTEVGLDLAGGGDARLVGSRDAALAGDNTANTLTGNGAANRLRGYGGDDVLHGRGDADTLVGGSGNDGLRGGAGRDRLEGGQGNDTLTGGGDIDTFVFRAGHGRDVIRDFDVINASNGFGDRVKLSRALWDVPGVDDPLIYGVEDLLVAFATDTAQGIRLAFTGGESLLFRGIFQPFDLQFSIDLIA
jgi:hypothetical protein